MAQAVRYNVKGAAHAAATGLSIYFPFHVFLAAQNVFQLFAALSFSDCYRAVLPLFTSYPLTNPPGTGLHISDPVANAGTIRATVTSPYWLSEQYIAIAHVGTSGTTFTLVGMDLAATETLGNDNFALHQRQPVVYPEW